ncbi:Transcriptional regulator, TetR family [Pseudoalteromonas luteoviolacea B = ATCC 29581]|nr:Transcriptional regulator, TetR family [Pseudoalteromonas luteoviolacea B = ATCC 29581]
MRTAEFDRTFVLRQAMQTFMQYGYSKTSMQRLTLATGLHPGSIYCAFKNKKGLLLAAIEQYQTDKDEQLKLHFSSYPTFKDGLTSFLESIVNGSASEECSRVCLLTKTLSEIEGQDEEVSRVLAKNLNQFEQTITHLFNAAVENKELSSQIDTQARAQFLVLGIYGLRTYAMTTNYQKKLNHLANQLLAVVLKNDSVE